MADLSPINPTDWGSMQTSFGNGMAQQALQRAQTSGVNAQTQATRIQAANTLLSYQLRRQALLDFAGQLPGPPPASADQSGTSMSGNSSGPGNFPTPPTDSSAGTQSPATDPAAGSGDSTGAPAPQADDLGESALNQAAMDAALRQRYFVNPVGSPQEQNFIAQAALSGDAGLLAMAKAQRDNNVATRTAMAQNDASQHYDAAAAVVSAPKGQAMYVLEGVAPNTARQIKKRISDPELEDEAARDTMAHYAAFTHQFTGRELIARADGTYVDKVSGLPVPDVPVSGMTAQQYGELWKSANTLVDVPQSDGSKVQMPQWEANKAPSAAAWVAQAAAQQQVAASLPSVEQLVRRHLAARAQAAAAGQSVAAQTVSGARSAGATGAPPTPSTAPVDPVMRQALSDPTYKIQTPPVRAGMTPTPAQLDQQKATVDARTDLLKEAQESTTAAAQSLQYAQAAKAIMQSKGAPIVGLWGKPIAEAMRALRYDSVDATNYQEVAKYLGNAALQNGKQNFGKNFTQREVALQLNELSPSTKMTPDAINNLLTTTARGSQYVIDSARRMRAYLATGGDPQHFAEWNEQYFPRAAAVNGPATGAAPPKAITSKAQYDALPSGALYSFNGRTARKP